MQNNKIDFSLGYNFDPLLIDQIIMLNHQYGGKRKITEFYAALQDAPYLSTRPNKRIKGISWGEFESQVSKLKKNGISFNYLFNAICDMRDIDLSRFNDYLHDLYGIGVRKIIAHSPKLCEYIKKTQLDFNVTISSVYGIKSKKQLDEAYESFADSVYLDSIYINRNFELLRELKLYSRVPLKLYANVSCLSQCEKKDYHYSVLSQQNEEYQEYENDALFAYCSGEKIKKKINWLQMQWIRPEDIDIYYDEGFSHFKLTDRLAATDIMCKIAKQYLMGKSPDNLFSIIERDGAKYKKNLNCKNKIISVISDKIPYNFIEHFRSGDCISNDIGCQYCNAVAGNAIKIE
jgi:collagenase-like PrtC family protease